jgi:hypothetical protein
MPAGEEAATASVPQSRPIPGPGDPVVFTDVEPIFLQRCIKCHSNKGLRGAPPEGLRLQTRDQILAGGDRIVVVPGNPGK